jgi:hypothetical protein
MNPKMLSLIALGATLAFASSQNVGFAQNDPSEAPAAPAKAVPYQKLANLLATPELASSQGPKDKSLLRLHFVGAGQSEKTWLKMTSIDIAKVKPEDTQTAARAIITKLDVGLKAQKHAKIIAFDRSPVPPLHAFFEFVSTDGVAAQGIAYSPAEGFVSVIQVAYKHGFVHGASDRNLLKAIIEPK